MYTQSRPLVCSRTYTVYIVAIINALVLVSCTDGICLQFVRSRFVKLREYTFFTWTHLMDVFERAQDGEFTVQYCDLCTYCARGGCNRQVCLAPFGPGESLGHYTYYTYTDV